MLIKALILFFCLIPFMTKAQTDILVLKKRGAHLRTYTVGDEITMETVYDQWLTGTISQLQHDSIYLNGTAFHYKEIKAIRRTHYNFGNTVLPYGMMAAAGGILVLNAVNGAYRHDKAKDWYTHSSIVTGISLLVGGFLLTRTTRSTYHLGHRFKLDYLELTFKKTPASAPTPSPRPF
jgi:hypothetical protein